MSDNGFVTQLVAAKQKACNPVTAPLGRRLAKSNQDGNVSRAYLQSPPRTACRWETVVTGGLTTAGEDGREGWGGEGEGH